MAKKDTSDLNLEGMDDFARDFLLQGADTEVSVSKGTSTKDKQLAAWASFRTKEFIERAETLCEDTMSFFNDNKINRGIDNYEAVFALALLVINFRHSWGNDPRSLEEDKAGVSEKNRDDRLKEFDKVCFYAQKYFDKNKDNG